MHLLLEYLSNDINLELKSPENVENTVTIDFIVYYKINAVTNLTNLIQSATRASSSQNQPQIVFPFIFQAFLRTLI